MALANQVVVGGPLTIGMASLPIGVAPSGTMAANGAVTLGTAISSAYPQVYLFFPAGAVFAGSPAGFYFCVMSSTTLGTVFNNVYIAGNAPALFPAILAPIVAAGPGAYTGVTTAVVPFSISVPANTLGAFGLLRISIGFSCPNNGNNKIGTVNFGGVQVLNSTITTNVTNQSFVTVANRGPGLQVATRPYTGANTNPMIYLNTVDTTQSQIIAYNLQLGVATDYIILETALVEQFTGSLIQTA